MARRIVQLFMPRRGLAVVVLISAAVLVLILGARCVDRGGSPATSGVSTPPTATTPLATTPAATQPPTETAPAPTEAPTVAIGTDTPTQRAPGPLVGCEPQRYRLNLDKLQAQPQLADAVVTAVNDTTVQIEIEGSRVLITGWGEVITIGGETKESDQAFHQVVSAVDAVRYEC